MRRKTRPRGMAESATLFELPDDAEMADPIGAGGHRARMRTRLLAGGGDSMHDHEMLEMILYLALPRRDTKPIAKALLVHFHDFPSVIAASLADLTEIEGLGTAGAAAFKIVQAASVRLARGAVLHQPVLNHWDKLLGYLRVVLAHERVEQCRVLFLDSRNRLLADECQGQGTVNHTPVYPREIVKRALQLNASSLILAHNHPSGDPTPSREDVGMTREIIRAAQPLGILVHDHIIIAGDRWVAFRKEGLM